MIARSPRGPHAVAPAKGSAPSSFTTVMATTIMMTTISLSVSCAQARTPLSPVMEYLHSRPSIVVAAERAALPSSTLQGPALTPSQEQLGINTNITGFRTALTASGLDYISSVAQKAIHDRFSSFSLPEISADKDHVKVTVKDITCKNFDVSSVKISPSTTVAGSITGITLSCSAHWEWKLHIWPHPHGSGSVDVSVSDTSVALNVGVGNDGNGHARVATKSASASIGHLGLHFHGGLTSLVLNLIKHLFHHTIKHKIEKTLHSKIGGMVNNEVNAALKKLPVEKQLHVKSPYNVTVAMIGLTGAPAVTPEFVGAGLQGYIAPLRDPNAVPPYRVPSIPTHDPSVDSYFQLMLSAFTVESGIYVYQKAGLLQHIVRPSAVPPTFPLKLNTNDPAWKIIAPGIQSKFPGDKVQIDFRVDPGFSVKSSPADNSFSLTIPVGMDVQAITSGGALSAFELGCPLTASLSMDVEDAPSGSGSEQVLTGTFKYLSCELALKQSSVGSVHYKAMKKAITFVVTDLIVPIANDLLKNGFPLPTTKGIKLTDTVIKFQRGYVVVGSKLDIDINSLIPTTSLPAVTASNSTGPPFMRVGTASLRGDKRHSLLH